IPKPVAPTLSLNLSTQSTGFFRAPTTGWNWGRLHRVNAVDIANACGTPVFAAASGFVVDARASGWTGGYGNLIRILHDNGM
ncbi:MAG: M23 family metallopeptidase, partial [Candidatus Paceibacteria bacterium]